MWQAKEAGTMKTRFYSYFISALAALVIPWSAPAQEEWLNRFYLQFDGGVAWMANTDVDEIFGMSSAGSRAEFDAGPRFGINAGYNVTDWFSGNLKPG
jgi:hypothetical protein